MAAQREASGAVVEQNVFTLGRVGQIQCRLMRGHGFEQQWLRFDRGGLPYLLAAVTSQWRKRIGCG